MQINKSNPPYKQSKKRKRMIISLESEKAFEKYSTHLLHKSHREIRDARDIPQHNKGKLAKVITNNNLNGEKLKTFLLKSVMK